MKEKKEGKQEPGIISVTWERHSFSGTDTFPTSLPAVNLFAVHACYKEQDINDLSAKGMCVHVFRENNFCFSRLQVRSSWVFLCRWVGVGQRGTDG